MLFSALLVAFCTFTSCTLSFAEGNLRGAENASSRRQQQQQLYELDVEAARETFRVLVFDNLHRNQDDGTFNHLDEIMAVPIVHGVEQSAFYTIDLPEEILAEHHETIEAGTLYVSVPVGTVRMTDDNVSFTDDVTIHVLDRNPIDVDDASPMEEEEHRPIDRHRALSRRVGKRTVCVLRVVMTAGPSNQRQVAYSTAKIRQQLFQGPISLKKQYESCSNDSLEFVEAGIFDVTVPGQVSDFASPAAIRNKALEIFSKQRGVSNAGQVADHVMVIIPPNTFPGFVGNAATGGYVSTLNNDWSLDVMVYMHEIGHNLSLGHAYLTDNSADYSSYMSATGWEPRLDGPKKCFNGASNRMMGWYDDRTETVNLKADPTRKMNLAAFTDAGKSNKQDPILIQVGEYSIQYNYAASFNAETEQLRNMVTISRSEPGKTVVEKDGLSPNGKVFTVNNFDNTGKTLRVAACATVNGNTYNPSGMTVGITLDVAGSPCNVAADPPPTTKPPPRTTQPPPLATQAPPPKQDDMCPDTRKAFFYFVRRKRKTVRRARCQWLNRGKKAQRFCNRNNASGGGKISDTCVQECAAITNACVPSS